MKYLFALITCLIVYLILAPVIVIRWSNQGIYDVFEGIQTLYGIDDF